MAGLLAAALHRQPRRLVQCYDVIVAVDDRALDHLGIVIADPCAHGLRGLDLVRAGQGRDAHLLAGLKTGAGLDAPTVDAQFALAAHLFDPPLGQMRKKTAQPAIQSLICVVCLDGKSLHLTHAHIPRASQTPNASPDSDSTTDSTT